jgi:D-alanine transaminase
MENMINIVFLNGSFIPHHEAKVSVFDRGFLFGDGAYEVIPVFGGKPLRMPEHLKRLQHSLDAIKITHEFTWDEIEKMVFELLQRNAVNNGDYSVYLQVTRGVDEERNFAFSEKTTPTIFAAVKKITRPSLAKLQEGVTAITLEDIRWKYCEIKSISLLPSVLLYHQVFASGCHEGILIRDGQALEGISSNIFIVKDGQIITPPLSQNNLSGVTRDLLLQIFRQNSINYVEQPIQATELYAAEELWISSSTRGVMPIVSLDGKAIGSGKTGPVWRKIMQLSLQYV